MYSSVLHIDRFLQVHMHSRWCAHGMALMVYGLEQWYPPHGVQGAARGGGTWGGDHKRVEGEVCMCVWPRGLQFIFHAISFLASNLSPCQANQHGQKN
jgi:hypothetical protein